MTGHDGPATEVPLSSPDLPGNLDAMSARRAVNTKGWRTCGPAAALVLVLAFAPAARAGVPSADIVRQGPCSGAGHWRLRVGPDDSSPSMLDVRFQLAGGSAGDTWNLYLDQNGTGFFAGSRVSGALGLVRISQLTPDSVGTTDVIGAAAHDIATGEVCQGRVRL